MRNLVLWSGGCDSTLLLYYLSKNNPNDNIHAISVVTNYAPYTEGAEKEYICRNNIKEYFNEIGIKNILYTQVDVNMPLNGDFEPKSNYMFTSFMYIANISPYIRSGDIVNYAFIREDVELHFKYPILNLGKMLSIIIGIDFKIQFPLEFKSKIDVLEEIINLNLLDKVSWCSHPLKDGSPCKKCRNCLMHYSALHGLKLKKGEIDESTL